MQKPLSNSPFQRRKLRPRRPVRRASAGFTLIEMLVVIAIIALLATMISSGVSRAMLTARRAQCMSNMRQIGLGVINYAMENRGRLPPTRHSAGAEEAWVTVLAPYLGEMDTIRICPMDPKGAERLARGGTSYLANDLIFDTRTDPFGQVLEGSIGDLSLIDNPSNTFLAVIASDNRGTGATNDHTHAGQWTSWNRFLSDVEADRFRRGGRHATRLRGESNYLYADGGVRSLQAVTLKEWIEGGRNPGEANNAPR
ncbi:MAG: DUF1559 domain-containing protein [Verrucomicrobia bacterium]|nr:DUF1559 domain-containing protein [Verrucomicrobiota bacterium]MCH8510668.1 DUF1559 domain-containing protein [Kiritimatiellia bacterium]